MLRRFTLAISAIVVMTLFVCAQESAPQQKIIPISEARTDANGDHIPDLLDQTVTIVGYASVGTGVLSKDRLQVYIQDDSGGIRLADEKFSAPIQEGDRVIATGVVGLNNGHIELSDVEYKVVESERRPPQPINLTILEARSEKYDGVLVQVKGRIIHKGRSHGDYLTINNPDEEDATVDVAVTSSHQGDLSFEDYSVGDSLEVTGILGQRDFNDSGKINYRIYLRYPGDIKAVGLTRVGYRTGLFIGGGGLVVILLWIILLQIQVKRRTRQLHEGQERYRLLFDSNPLPMWVFDQETLSFLAVNDAAIHHYGYSREEFLAMTVKDVRLVEDVPDFLEYLKNITHGFDRAGEHRHRKKDGTIIHVEITTHSLVFDGRPSELALVNDITSRKRNELERQVISEIIQGVNTTSNLDELLQLVHRLIGKLIYAENCFIALLNRKTNSMRFEFWVDKFDPAPPPRPVGKGFSSYVLRTGRPLLLTEELKSQMYERGEVERSGTTSASWLGVPLCTPAQIIGVLVVQNYEDAHAYSARDLEFLASVGGQVALAIERKLAEEQIRDQLDFTTAITSNLGEGIYALDQEGRVTFMNPVAEQLLGWKQEELRGQVMHDVIHFQRSDGTSVPREECGLMEVLRFGKATHVEEDLFTRKDGTMFPVTYTATPIITDGQVTGVVGAFQDTTEHKKLEDQLRQSQKMEAIGQLAGGVAHDFNNLLTAITGYSDLTLRKMGQTDPLRRNIEEIRKAGERAASLTRQLLAFSRKQILQPKAINLNDLVADTNKMLRRLIGEDIELVTALKPGLGQVKADPGQMEQVLMNLVVNARDAMPAGGKLIIETANVQMDEEIVRKYDSVQPGSHVRLTVSDTGCGMDAETQKHIFEPFFTTKEVGKGTGLGLSTVYGIVKQSGGYISAYSEVGRGTSFKIYLPRVDEVIAEPEEVAAEPPHGSETVLLVEDEEVVRNMTRAILEESGYMVLEAASGTEALRICKERQRKIELILTDVVMPQMSGRQFVEQAKLMRPEIRVLYMSGYTDDAIVHHGVLEEGTAFIEKPFTPDALARKVREILEAQVVERV